MNMRCVLASLLLLAGVGVSLEAASQSFPLTISANGRYLQGSDGTPFPILGRSYWGIIGLTPTNYQAALQDWKNKGGNAIEFRAPNGTAQDNFEPFDGAGHVPFTTNITGGTYTGTSLSDTFPDFTTPNEPYWQFLDTFIAYCESQGIAVLWFPLYIGVSDAEGWSAAMRANGPTKMQAYGAYVANRYKNRKNIIWLLGGDKGTPSRPFTAQEEAAEGAFIAGLKSVAGQQSTQYTAEWHNNSYGDEQVPFGPELTLNGSYSFDGDSSRWARNGYGDSPIKPTFVLEEPYDEEGADGTNKNPNATQPTRRFIWGGLLNSIGGYMEGNGYLIHFFPGYTSHFNSQTQLDLARLNTFYTSIAWYQLVPSGLGGMKTLITAGSGSVDTSTYVAAAAAPNGSLLVAYSYPNGTASRSFTVDMTAMSAASRARWFNPTSGTYTDIGSSLPNSGTRQFTTPGNNGTNFNDWVLVLDTGAAPVPLKPNPPTNLTVQ
jgi:uncharacterized protein DUF4038/collagenase-like protein with putative collagen-binding domain